MGGAKWVYLDGLAEPQFLYKTTALSNSARGIELLPVVNATRDVA